MKHPEVSRTSLRAALWLALLLVPALRCPLRCGESEAATPVKTRVDVVYWSRAGEELALDIAWPAEDPGPHPGVLLIHGGGWRAGSRKDFLRSLPDFARSGFVAASVSYRFTPRHSWPAQLDDVRAALRWLRAHSTEFRLDPHRIAAMGFSAGGHLSLLLGLWPEKPSLGIQAVVNYFGPTDLRTDVFNDRVDELIAALAGGSREHIPGIYAEMSPVVHVAPGDAPVLTFQGTEDPLVPVEQARLLHRALEKARVPGRLEVLEGRGHGWGGSDLESTTKKALAFLDLYLRGSDLPLVWVEDFGPAARRWEPTDPDAWKMETRDGHACLSLTGGSNYEPPVRSPANYALLRGIEVSDFVLDVLLRSTTRDYGHRDLCLFFGYRDPSHFYYVHLGKKADPNSHSIFIVDDGPRAGIATERTDGIPWDDAWHRVRVRRVAESGLIEVFFDDMSRPIMKATDRTFLRGRIGLGSFDDTGSFTQIRLRGRLTRAEL